MSSNTPEILGAEAIAHKVQRLAWELYDRHSKAEQLYVVGIQGNGYWLAQQLVAKLNAISDIKIELMELVLDKSDPKPTDMQIDLPFWCACRFGRRCSQQRAYPTLGGYQTHGIPPAAAQYYGSR